jgi:hypothetical protein
MTPLAANVSTICCHLNLIGGRVTMSNLQIEIAWGAPDHGPVNARLFPVDGIREAAYFASRINAGGCNVYVGTSLKRVGCHSSRRTSASDAALATCLAIDIDSDLVAAARQLPGGIKPQLLAVSGRVPALRGHIWIGIEPTADFPSLDEIGGRAVRRCGGDMAARGRAALMRAAGTLSFPSATKRKRGYCTELVVGHFIDAPAYSLRVLASAFPQLPSFRPMKERTACFRGLSAFPGADVRRVEAALHALPLTYAEAYDLWIRTGLALHSFDPGPRGLFLWRKFSQRCPAKAAVTDFEYRWGTFGQRHTGRQLTVSWLFSQARKHACEPLLSDLFSTSGL